MPELPEVETIKNELIPHVVGRRVTGITLFWEKMVVRPPVAEFRVRLIGQEVKKIGLRKVETATTYSDLILAACKQ